MKTLITLLSLLLAIVLISCGDTQPRDFEEEQPPATAEQQEEQEPTLAETIIGHIGEDFYTGENAFSEGDWERMKNLTKEISELREKSEERFVNKEDLESLFDEYGYANFEEGKQDVHRFAELQDFVMSMSIRLGEIRTRRMMGDDEEAEKTIVSMRNSLQQREFTKEDLIAIDENSDVIGRALASRFMINTAR